MDKDVRKKPLSMIINRDNAPMIAIIAERGPEVIVPLDQIKKPLT